jgi:hypothetical protein
MDAIEALRIARLALAMHFDIEPDVVAGRYVGAYVAIGAKKCDIDAAEAYNKLAEMQQLLMGLNTDPDDACSCCGLTMGESNLLYGLKP